MDRAADFFVSYTNADRAWAEWIAWQLEAEGYKVVVQAWDFTAGRDWAHEMQHATATAERVVAVLSATYLRSAHGEAEWRAFYAQDPSGEQGLLLPVRVDKVDPPGLLKTRIYVDLADQDAASARGALLAAVRGARGKPTKEPEFPGAGQVGRDAERPRFPGELPPVWNVAYHPNRFFTGRDLVLAEMRTRLNAADPTSRRVVLTGLGGVGKTQLAVEYAYRHRFDYDLVWWVRAHEPTSLLGDYAALATQPPLAAELRVAPDGAQETLAPMVRGWLEHQPRWLLLLDNVVDPQSIVDLLPRSANGHVVVTSRAGVGWEQLATPLPVEGLAPTDAAAFLLARTGETGADADAAATTLADSLDGLPLALEQAGAYVAATGTVSLSHYAALFDTRALELLKRGQPLGYQHTVATIWSLALQRLRETEPAAVDLLILASFLAPDDLPLPLLAGQRQELPGPLASTAADPLALADAVAALRRYSLIRVVADGLYIHRLVQTVVRASLDVEAERTWAATAVRLLRAGFPETDEVANWPECERLLPHALAAADHGQRLEVESERWLWLLTESAHYLLLWGQARQALALLEQTRAGYRRLLGDDHPYTLTSMNNLATTRRALGDLDGARQLFEQALAAFRRVLGDDHPDTLNSMSNLAATRQDLGDLQGARKLHEQALAGLRRVLGDDHPYTLNSMNNLAATRRSLGDLDGARQLHEQALTARRRVLGDDHSDTLLSMNNLASILAKLGDLDGARQLFEQALAARRRVLGDDHPDTLTSMNNLATTRRTLGNLDGARQLFEQALAGRRRVLGDDHPDTLTSMRSLAEVSRELDEL
jgi:tetratricopeptide (TPR) repeat protein